MSSNLRYHLISKACVLFSDFAVKVYDEITRECRNFSFDSRDMLLSPQIVFSFVRPAVVGTNFERTSGYEPTCTEEIQQTFNNARVF